jgi:hypothetical protein
LIRLFAPLEYHIKFECDPQDFFAGSKKAASRLFCRLLALLGPRPRKTDFRMKKVRNFLRASGKKEGEV